MIKQIMLNKNINLSNWTTRDLLVMASISLVFTIIIIIATYFYMFIIIPLGLIAGGIASGIWAISGIFTMYILRRPGAALFCQLLIGIIQVPFSPFGWMTILLAVILGIPTELAFLSTRYRNFNLFTLMIAGILANVLHMALVIIPLGFIDMEMIMQILIIISVLFGGGMAGLLAKILADAIAKTGVLSGYSIGQEFQEEI
ncbi:MAG: ECF transporter S component [Methanosarcinales archaeon]|nr:ECF transporter S component [Methanosarcinales archaeon]